MKKQHAERARVIHYLVFGFSLVLLFACLTSSVQAASPITSSGLNTQVGQPITLPSGQTQYDITGGTRAGTNLFHSFGDFGIPNNNIANFLNTPVNGALPATSNILGRVTGGNISNIYGTIQTTGFGGANLFLMNPAGFLFGPNATVNVGGMVAFTSADYLRLQGADGGIFYADPTQPSVLTTSPVAAFGFLGSNPGAITVQGSQFALAEGSGISLVGGNITVQSGVLDDGVSVQPAHLSAPGGQINLVSVASPGEVLNPSFNYGPNVNGAQFTSMGNISVTQGSLVDVSADSAGTIRIRGGELVIDHSTISADTGELDGASVAIDIAVTGGISLSNTDVPALAARSIGAGNAGDITISSGNLSGDYASFDFTTGLIDTHTIGSGNGGNVTISTGPLTVNGNPGGNFIYSGTLGEGNGGNVTITAEDVHLTSTQIQTGDNSFTGLGNGGNLTIMSSSLELTTSSLLADSLAARAGAITLESSGLISVTDTSFVTNTSLLGENPITIKADRLSVGDNSIIQGGTALLDGGDISVTARIVELSNGGAISTQTFGDGNAGNINITATDRVSLLNSDSVPGGVSGITTQSLGFPDADNPFGLSGNAGNISINTPSLELTNGTRINSSTLTSGRGGDVTIVSDNISIMGETSKPVDVLLFGPGGTKASGIYTNTLGSETCSGPCGDAGNISISTGVLNLEHGGVIDSGTTNNGTGGNITINASQSISISGTMADGTPSGVFSRSAGTTPDAGIGGNINLYAANFNVINGAQISASTLGPGNAGSVTIEGTASPAQSVLIDGFGSGIFTDTQGTGAGGNIFVNASTVALQNGGTLSASTSGTEATATGGTITIESGQVQLSGGAQVRSETFGAGAAGTIQVTATGAVTLTGTSADLQVPTRISANTFSAEPGAGAAGDITVTARTFTAEGGASITSGSFGEAAGGTIQVTATESVRLSGEAVNPHTLSSSTGEVEALGFSSGLFTDGLGRVPGAGAAGDIVVTTGTLTVEGGAGISSSTVGHAAGGTIRVVADAVTLSGTNFDGRIPSGLQALSLGDLAPPFFGIQGSGTGAAGDIVVTTGTLTVEGGAMITSSSFGPGAGGKIQVTATESVTLTGGNLASDVPDSNFVGGNASGLFAQTGGILPGAGNGGTVTMTTPILNMNSGTIATSTSSSGNAGSITLSLGTATLTNNATITSSSTGQATGAAGTVTIQGLASPSKSVSIDGTGSGIFTNTEGTGRGGDIHLFANSVTLQNGAHVSSSSTGTGPNAGRAGDITINAGNQLRMTNSSVTTEADAASGGAIKITTNPEGTVQLTDSTISASVLDGAGGGGSVNIDPQFVILQNSQILAKAIFGPGGNISITTNLLLQDANSIISASSQFGQQGTITIQSPIDPAGGKIIPLSQKPLIATAFLSQRCAAMAGGEFSGLTVAGRDSLPAEPSSWLASPLAMTTVEFSSSSVTNTGTTMSMHEPAKEAPLLSLRQIAPPGFLTHAFAADSSAGCTS